jgi:peptidoglycan/LPS O-acetylase OafA/YrhL
VWFIPAYLLVVVLTLIPATLLHVTVEKPFMNLRDRLSRAPVSAAPPIAGKA